MFPGGVDPRQMKKMMKRMGISSEELDAEQVIIKCVDKEIIIDNPSVMKTVVQGQQMFQIQGDVRESSDGDSFSIAADDVELVMEQTKVSEEKAIAALEKTKGDIAQAILELKS
jgi:nascent polypeptide-associated complex subunit alpha